MLRPLWQLLLEDPSHLTCDECFAVMEYYAEVLGMGSTNLLPEVIEMKYQGRRFYMRKLHQGNGR